MSTGKFCLTILFALILSITGCTDSSNSQEGTGNFTAHMSFNGKNAKVFYALEDSEDLNQISKSYTKSDNSYLSVKSESGNNSVSNFIAVDENGETWLPMESNLPIRILYSVIDPGGEYLYVMLYPGIKITRPGAPGDDENYSMFISLANCNLFRIKLADNTITKVVEGILAIPLQSEYYQKNNISQKPLYFDDDNNLYFVGNYFEPVNQDILNNILNPDSDPETEDSTFVDNYDGISFIKPIDRYKFFKVSAADGTVTTISKKNKGISWVHHIKNSSFVYYGESLENSYEKILQLYRDGESIQLDKRSSGFFAAFSESTFCWIINNELIDENIVFATVDKDNTIRKSIIDLKEMIGSEMNKYMLDKNGALYAITGFYNYQWIVRSILPYRTESVSFIENKNKYSSVSPYHINGYHIYLKALKDDNETEQKNVLCIQKTASGNKHVLFSSQDYDLDVYSIKQYAEMLHVLALNKVTNKVIHVVIDTNRIKSVSDETYVTIHELNTLNEGLRNIKDITYLNSFITEDDKPETDDENPHVVNFYAEPENRFAPGVEFSKEMNWEQVVEKINLVDENNTIVDTLKINHNNTLYLLPVCHEINPHGILIPDYLDFNSRYSIIVDKDCEDVSGNTLSDRDTELVHQFKTVPAFGWYHKNDGTANYRNNRLGDTYSDIFVVDLGVEAMPENYQIDLKYYFITPGSSMDFILYKKDAAAKLESTVMKITMRSYIARSSEISYSYAWDNDTMYNNFSSIDSLLQPYEWHDISIKIYGKRIVVMINGEMVVDREDELMPTRDALIDYDLLFRNAHDDIRIDNLQVSTLSASGNIKNYQGDLVNNSFDSHIKVNERDSSDDSIGFDFNALSLYSNIYH